MKRTFFLTTFCISQLLIKAQFNVTINGKKVTANQEFNYADLKSFSVNFTNPQKLPAYADGDLSFYCSIKNKEGESIAYLAKGYSGYAPVSVALGAKTPKEYVLMPNTEDGDFLQNGNSSKQFSYVCESLKSNPKAEKVTIEFSLIFNENLGTKDHVKKYGQNIELLDRFSFVLNIADKNAMINCTSINAKFKLSDFMAIGFKSTDSLNSRYELKKISKQLKEDPRDTRFYFEKYWFSVNNFKYNSSSNQDDNLNELKKLADKNATLYANGCNPKPMFKLKGTDNTEENSIYDSKINYLFNIGGDKIVEKFDRKNNKKSENETLWEAFSIGSISGFKSINLLKNNPCRKDPVLGSTMSAKAEDRIVTGASLAYVIKNPNNPESILVFTWFSSEKTETLETLNKMAQNMEKFISLLNFIK